MRKILHHSATAWIILLTSLGVTFLGWRVSSGYAERRAKERFDFAAEEAETLIRKRMLEYEQVLRGGVGLMASSDRVTRDDWRLYVEQLRVQDYFPGIQGIGFARVLEPDEVPGFEARVRADGFPDFAVTPAGEREVYTSIEFLEPFDTRNRRAFGYDMFSHPVRRAAMERARDTGEAAMSAKVILLQEIDSDVQPGVLTYLPLYRTGAALNNVTQRRAALLGYVYAPFRMSDLMRGILDHTRREVDVRVYDGANTGPDAFLHDTTGNGVDGTDPATEPTYREQRRVEISGHPWTLEFTTNSRFDDATSTQQPALIAGTGVVIDTLLFIIIATLGSHYRSQAARADAATSELATAAQVHDAVVASSGAAIIVTDLSGTIQVFNPAAESLLGYRASELVGKATPAVFHDPEEVVERAAQFSLELGATLEPGFRVFVAKTDLGLPNTHEWRYVRKDGSAVPVLLSVTAIRDADGAILSYLGVATDNSELHAARTRLNDTLAEVRSLNRALDDHAIVAITDVQGTITEVNQKFCDISGYSRSELIGQNHRMINSRTHDREFFQNLWRTIAGGRVWHGEIRNRAKDGTYYWVETTIVPVLDPEQKPQRYISIRTDITAQKRSTELLNESQHLARVGGWEYIVPLGRVTWTQEAARIHRATHTLSATIEQKLAFYRSEDAARLREHLDRVVADGSSFDLELRTKHGDGEPTRWLRVTGRGEVTDSGIYRVSGSVQDIDEIKHNQLALAASEARFRTLASTLPVGLWEVDAEGYCLYTNQAWQDTAEMTLEESLGRGYAEAVHPEDREGLFAAWEQAVATDTLFSHDFRFKTKSGKIRWVHSIGTAARRDGKVVGYVGGNLDITDRKHVSELLEKTQRIAAIGGWELDLVTNTLTWSEQTYRIHEVEPGTPVAVSEAINFYHPDDRERISTCVNRAIADGVGWDETLRIITGTSQERWVRAVGEAEFQNSKPFRLLGTFQDVDETKRAQLALVTSEQRFRTLTAALPVGVFETGADGRCTYTNSSWQRIAGLSAEEAVGDEWGQTLHPDDRQNVFDTWSESMAQLSDFELEFRFQHRDGAVRWVHSSATPIRRDHHVVGFVGVLEDITERRASVERMAASLTEKEVLLREVHHRVKNNLQLVVSLLKLQAAGINDPLALEQFQESQRRVRTMAMVHEMLYAHTSLARVQIDVYLTQLAQGVTRSFQSQDIKVALDLNLAPVSLTPDQSIPLGLIVNEMLTNAHKHGARPGHELRVQLTLTEVGRGHLVLTLADNGPGIPPDHDPTQSTSLGNRLISLLSKQIRGDLTSPKPGEPAHYRLEFAYDVRDEPRRIDRQA